MYNYILAVFTGKWWYLTLGGFNLFWDIELASDGSRMVPRDSGPSVVLG